MSAQVSKIVGTPNNIAWAQVHHFENKSNKGRLIAVVSVKITKEAHWSEPIGLGKKLLEKLRLEYYKEDNKTPFEALEESVGKTYDEFSKDSSLEIITSVVVGQYVYFCSQGGGGVFLWREGNLARVFDKTTLIISSGNWQDQDVFVLGTDEFFNKVNVSDLKEKLVLENLVEVLGVHSASSPAFAGAIVKTVKGEGDSGSPFTDVTPEIGSGERPHTFEEERTNDRKVQNLKRENVFKSFLKKFAYKLPDREISIRKNETSSRRTAVSIGIVLLVLLVSSLAFGIRQKRMQDYKSSYEESLVRAQSAYSQAIEQKDLNPPQARQLFTESKNMVDELLSRNIKDERIDQLKTKIDADMGSVLGKIETKFEVFIDLSLVRSGIRASDFSINGDKIAVLDTGGQRLISVSTTSKKIEVLAGTEKIGNSQAVSLLGDSFFSYGNKGIVLTDSKGSSKVMIEPDQDWGSVNKIAAFGTSLYLLDGKGQIWRYAIVDKSEKQRWLKEDTFASFENSVDFAIDGSLWILSGNGEVSKFTRGVKDPFLLTGLEKKLANPVSIYINEKLDGIYILDKGISRIVKFTKSGEFEKEYVSPDIENGKDLVVSNNKIFLLTDTKILETALR